MCYFGENFITINFICMRQSNHVRFLAVLFIAFIWSGCQNDQGGLNAGKIPLDERRAAESVISIDTAKQYQANFIRTRDSLRRLLRDTSFLRQNFNLPNAEFFTRDAIILLLNQTGADGVRIYYGKDNTGVTRLVLLPVDKNGKDIQAILIQRGQTNAISIPGIQGAQAAPTSEFQAIENGQTCPPCIID
jgi:hypothetical protein